MKLGTLVSFPITGLDMSPFLASPRTQSRPSSATPLSTYKTQCSKPKSVHFEDEVKEEPKSPLERSVSAGKGKGKRFLFSRKKHQRKKHQSAENREKQGDKKRGSAGKDDKKSSAHSRSHPADRGRKRSKSPESSRRSYSPPPGSESPTSVRSAPSTINRNQLQPHHRYFLPPNSLQTTLGSTSLNDSRLSNIYDLYAVCNHSGTLSHGHYTAFCKNPADGRWYNYDDSTVQPVSEDQLITAGAYMLFYIRQSLVSSSPLSSSESSESSSSNSAAASHWLYHMPPFRLDMNDYREEFYQMQQQQQQQQQTMQSSQQTADNQHDISAATSAYRRSRLDSSNSFLSGQSYVGSCVSPPVSAPDVDSFDSPGPGSVVNSRYSSQDARSDAFSAVSLPPYQQARAHHITAAPATSTLSYSRSPSYKQAVSYRTGSSTRHQSLRLGRGRERGGEGGRWTGGGNGNMPQQQSYPTQRSHEDLSSQTSCSGPSPRCFQGYVTPTRSIPSLPTQQEFIKTPNKYYTEQSHSFTNSQLHQKQSSVSNGHIPVNLGTHFKSPSLGGHSHPESCV